MEINKLYQLTGHKGSIYGLAYDENNETIYSAGGDGWIVQWSPEKSTDGVLLAKIDDKIFSLAYVPVFELFLAGTQSGDFYFIPVDKNKPPRRFEYHEKGIFDILIVDGIALTAGGDGKLGVWDIEHERLTESILVSNSKLRSLSKSNHQSVFAVSASDQNIYLLDAVQFSLQHTITAAHIPSVFSTQFSPDGKYLVSGGRDALVKVWDIKEGYDLQKQLSAHWFTINDLCFDQSGKLLFTGSRDKTVRIWDTGTWALLKEINLQKYDSHQNSINCILWLENRRHLITAGDDRKIMIWAVEEY